MAVKKRITGSTSICHNMAYEGETIEMKITRVVQNKEPIEDTAPIVYTDRRDGVRPEFNIRTDRFDVALDAMDVAEKSQTAKRIEFYQKIGEKEKAEAEKRRKSSENESIQGDTSMK